jgi:3'-phosphoadenosine 5'-phosphosulfate sulfotransferase (PAPS reductase)/FAD synthetase
MKGDFIKVGNKDAVVVHNTSNINRPVVKLLENNKILDLSKNLKLKINFEKVEGCDVNEYYNTIRKDEKYYYM